jgi:cytochrome c
MKRMCVWMMVGLLTLILSGVASAKSSQDEAKALVDKAAAFYKANGKDATLKELSNPKGQFVKGELYVFAYALSDGTTIAHPHNPKLIGKNLTAVPDPDGKLFRKEIWEQAKSKGSGWVDYKFQNPESKKIENKTTYFLKVDELILNCGTYK